MAIKTLNIKQGTLAKVKAQTPADNTIYLVDPEFAGGKFLGTNADGDIVEKTVDGMVGATASAPGKAGLVPQPLAGDEGKVLSGAGTWIDAGAANVQSDFNQTDDTQPDFIKNKPKVYTTIGDNTDGYMTQKAVKEAISGITGFTVKVVDALPTTGEQGILYFVQKTDPTSGAYCEQWIWDTTETTPQFKEVGTTIVKMSDYYDKTEITELMEDKVDKETGKGLSTEDFTTVEKEKLATVEENAQENVQSDWAELDSTSDAFIKNKPDVADITWEIL